MRKKGLLHAITVIAVAAFLMVLVFCLTSCAKTDRKKIEKAILRTEDRIASYHQTDAAFADTLMYFLPKSCVYDDEEGFLIHYKNKNYLYTDVLTESARQYTFYNTVRDAAAAENTAGQTVYTLGYHKQYDGGCARYTVDESATSEISLENNAMRLNYASKTNKVSLRQMGWNGDEPVAYQNKFEAFTVINTLVFSNGEYAFHDVIRTDRDNVNYFGVEATIYSANNFGGNTSKTYDALWSVRKRWSSNKIIINQTYSGINFEMRQKTYNPQIEGVKELSYLMQIAYCDGVSVYNCNFLVPKGLNRGELKSYSTHCVDCYTSWQNVTFDGCSFENYSYANYGGAIGFRDIYNTGCENLTFTNNVVVTSARDEGVALFAGLDKRNHQDDFELGSGYIRNCRLENNTFRALEAAEGLEPRTMFLTVGYQLSPVYNIKYLNNTFDGYCNGYFLHYCYCHGLEFRGNTVTLHQTGNTKRMTLIYHNDSPSASDILVENNVFNLQGSNFQLNSTVFTSPYSDAEELTFRNNVVNIPEGYSETVIGGDATVENNVFNLNRAGSIYYRTCGDVSNNTYNIKRLEKSVFEFYNANAKHDYVVKGDAINVDVGLSNLLMFNGTAIRFNGYSVLFEDVKFNIKKVDKQYYHLAWSTDAVTGSVVSITFRRCTFGAFEGHLQIANGTMHTLTIE